MKVMVTGDRGYIGAVLVEMLREKGHVIIGYDVDYFKGCELSELDDTYERFTKDIRDVEDSDLTGVDAIVHLAGLSNDPLGEFEPQVTEDVNFLGTKKLLNSATRAGVGRFVFASSQSMYGVSETDRELGEDDGEKNPVTSYAKTKWEAEKWLLEYQGRSNSSPIITCFRPSTVFGVSPKLRCDIVFNNFVACAYTTGKIEIKTDGTPWRPVVHVRDVCQAFTAGLEASTDLISRQVFNVGVLGGNYTVRELAIAAQKAVPGCNLVFHNEETDPRTYRVNFDKILRILSAHYKPKWSLEQGAVELVSYFNKIGFNEEQFRGRCCNRIIQLRHLRENRIINKALRGAP